MHWMSLNYLALVLMIVVSYNILLVNIIHKQLPDVLISRLDRIEEKIGLLKSGKQNTAMIDILPAAVPAAVPATRKFLAAALMVRIYAHDKAELKVAHLLQWIHFVRYAGVDHVYLYDAYQKDDEKLQTHVSPFEFVTYHDWSEHGKPEFTLEGTQVTAYQHAIDNYGDAYVWHMALDIDEYPTSEADIEPDFLYRYLSKVTDEGISEIVLPNYLLVGGMNRDENMWMGERYTRLFLEPDTLCKPIYRPRQVRAQVHHNSIITGHSIIADRNAMRLSHFQGARHDNWALNISQRLLERTEDDMWMPTLIQKVKGWLLCHPAWFNITTKL